MSEELIEGMNKASIYYKIFESEGLEYFFTGYINIEKVSDPYLRKYVQEFIEARDNLLDVLDELGVNEEAEDVY